jgi:hypothetical protein
MEQLFVVFSLVFSNENTFKDISKDECKKLLNTSCSMCMLNYNIRHQMKKYSKQHLHNKTKVQVQEYFNILDYNIMNILFAKNDNDNEVVSNLYLNEIEIIRMIQNSNNENIFINFLIAEFKERAYECIYYRNISIVEKAYSKELERIILDNYGENTLLTHRHDPSHFMYDDRQNFYMFYEMIENNGLYILDSWKNIIWNDLLWNISLENYN